MHDYSDWSGLAQVEEWLVLESEQSRMTDGHPSCPVE